MSEAGMNWVLENPLEASILINDQKNKIAELEQQLADADAAMSQAQFNWEQAETKLTERDKLLDETEKGLAWLVKNTCCQTLPTARTMLTKLQERER